MRQIAENNSFLDQKFLKLTKEFYSKVTDAPSIDNFSFPYNHNELQLHAQLIPIKEHNHPHNSPLKALDCI